MMVNKTVFWTKAARSDLEEIINYIASDSVSNALSVLEKLELKAVTLVSQADPGRLVPELSHIDVSQYHELIEKPWRVIYRIEASKVFILAVLDSRRDLSSVLLQRLIRE
jgi:plasmid stabilization system protein ParE